jgi:hypothetical protein
MSDLTSTNIIKQSQMEMSDGSVLTYNIDITLQSRQEDTIAYQQIKEFCGNSIDPIEHMLVHLLVDPSIEEEDDEDDQGDDDSIDDDDDEQETLSGDDDELT